MNSAPTQISEHFSASISWQTDPDTMQDVLRGVIQFTPKSDSVDCASIRMVQIAKIELSPGIEYDWADGSGEDNRNLLRTLADPARMILPGFYVDHDASRCAKGQACSPYFRDSWPNPDDSQDGMKSAAKTQNASLADYPFGWQLFQSIQLESCAVCVDTEKVYGCVHWGADWPNEGDRQIFPPQFSPDPSPTYIQALDIFHQFYR